MRTAMRVLYVAGAVFLAAFGVYQFMENQELRREFTELQEAFDELLDTRRVEFIAHQEELDAKQIALDEQTAQLLAAQSLLHSQQVDLETLQTTLYEQQEELDTQTLLLAALQLALGEQKEELELKDLALQGAQAQIDAAQLSILAQRQQLDSQQHRLDSLVGVRVRIIENLSEELRKANLDVTVDAQTGAIAMQGAVLFDVGRSALKPEGKALLDELIPVYVRTLLAEGNREFVAEIIIEGHADTAGDFLPSLRLSQARAMAVAEHCLADGFGGLSAEEREMLRGLMTANGRSSSNPIRNADGSENMDASRRVEIKFRLRETEMIDEMRAILEAQPPPVPTE